MEGVVVVGGVIPEEAILEVTLVGVILEEVIQGVVDGGVTQEVAVIRAAAGGEMRITTRCI